ncbi:hypothetical protein ACWEQ2_36130 [Streptomyces sp. NPDC004096]
MGVEERGCAGEEACAGGALLVGEGFGVGEAGVVVAGVDEVVAQPPEGSGPFTAAVGAMAAASRDLAELPHVHVDQVDGLVVFVAAAAGSGRTDDLPAQRVAGGKQRHLVTAEDPADHPGGNAGVPSERVRSASQGSAGLEHATFYGRGHSGGTVVRPTAAIVQPGPAPRHGSG